MASLKMWLSGRKSAVSAAKRAAREYLARDFLRPQSHHEGDLNNPTTLVCLPDRLLFGVVQPCGRVTATTLGPAEARYVGMTLIAEADALAGRIQGMTLPALIKSVTNSPG